jgi:glyoxylase-like metal-dependent hydrolase (beta-lactamase superfamily II)
MLNKLTDRVYYMPHSTETDRPSLGLVCGDKYSLLIDSGNSPKHAKEFLDETRKVTIAPLKYLIITHFHWDHVFGIKEMKLVTISHEDTREELEKLKSRKWDDASMEKYIADGIYEEFTIECIKKEIPDRENFIIGDLDMTFKDSIQIDLGGVTCIIKAVGGDHTDDSSVVYVPEEKVLFLGDCVYGRRYNGAYGYTMERVNKLIESVKEFDAEHYLISHENLYNRQQIEEFWDQLKSAGEITGDGTSAEEAIEKYAVKYGSQPSEDIAFYIKCYTDVNRARK